MTLARLSLRGSRVASVLLLATCLAACGTWKQVSKTPERPSQQLRIWKNQKMLLRATMTDGREITFHVRDIDGQKIEGESRRIGTVALSVGDIEVLEVLDVQEGAGEGTVVGTMLGVLGLGLAIGFLFVIALLSALGGG